MLGQVFFGLIGMPYVTPGDLVYGMQERMSSKCCGVQNHVGLAGGDKWYCFLSNTKLFMAVLTILMISVHQYLGFYVKDSLKFLMLMLKLFSL